MTKTASGTWIELGRARGPVDMAVRVLVNHRGFHETTRARGWEMDGHSHRRSPA